MINKINTIPFIASHLGVRLAYLPLWPNFDVDGCLLIPQNGDIFLWEVHYYVVPSLPQLVRRLALQEKT